jgi:CheY-like chemotaxis protein
MGVFTALQTIVAAPAAPHTVSRAHLRPVETLETPRVLVVESDEATLRLLERILSDGGYLPVLTTSSQAALQMARTMRPAAIVLDMLMPGFDGWDVLAALKSEPATATIPVLMLTMLSERSRALQNGAAQAIRKPLDGHTLRSALANALRQSSRR